MSTYSDVFLNFVGGQWKQGSTGQWETNRNPARPSEIIGKATRSNAVDATRALEIAQTAFAEWSARPRSARAGLIAHAASLLKSRSETLAKTIAREQGKNLSEARGEALRTVQALEQIASDGRQPVGSASAVEGLGFSQVGRAPLGVVVVFGSWNLPALGIAARTAAALLEGNTVLLKPSSLVPATASLVARAFEEAALPAGAFNMLYGSGAVLAPALVDDARVRAVAFEGSAAVARDLRLRAAARAEAPRMYLDSAPRSAAVVQSGAPLEALADALCAAAFAAGSGASACSLRTAPLRRVAVEATAFEGLASALATRARALTTGDGTQNPTALAPLPDERRLAHALELVEEAVKEGATVVCGGERVGASGPDAGWHLSPTILANVTPAMRIAREAISGPVLLIETPASLDAWIGENSESCASLGIFARDVEQGLRLARLSRASATRVGSNPATPARDERFVPTGEAFSRPSAISVQLSPA